MKENSKNFCEYIASSQKIEGEIKKEILDYIKIVNEELSIN